MNKQLLFALCAMLLFALTPNISKASHASGGEISYEWVSDSTYRVYYKFYRFCGGANSPGSVSMCYFNSCNSYSNTVTMTKIAKLPDSTTNGSPVSTGCAGIGTRCSSTTSPIPGYEGWWYTATVTLPYRCNYWTFSAFVNARNPSMNINGGSLYVEATLNNVAAQGNSSPYFSVKPVPSVCLNQSYTYNNGGVDPNSDSLVFEMARPVTASGGCPYSTSVIAFKSGSPTYNITTNPIQSNNTFSLDTVTGQMTFTPSLTGASTLTTRIKEYRNNVLIGTVMRDIQVQVIACTVPTPVVTTVSNTITGGTYVNGRVEACAGVQMSFCFDMVSSDTAAILVPHDNHTAAAPGSSVSYVGAQTDSIRGCFTWTPGTVDTGLRVFTVTVRDSTCNSPGVLVSQTFVLPIYIWPITDIIKDTTLCYGDTVKLLAVGGSNFTWSVLSGGSSISSMSCTGCKEPYVWPLQTTQYVVSNSATQYCRKNRDTATVTVVDIRHDTLQATSNSPVCEGDTFKLFSTSAPSGNGYMWTGPGAFVSTVQNPVIANAAASGTGNYILTSSKGNCRSFPDTIAAVINARPSKPTANNNGPLCAGSTLILTSSSVTNATYVWTGPNSYSSPWQNAAISNADTGMSGNYIITAISTINSCPSEPDTTTVVINHIPVIDSVTYVNPTTCGGIQGSITVWGLSPNATYTVNYKKNGVAQSPAAILADGSGKVLMNSLGAATYSQITVSLSNCSSDTAAIVVLTEPLAPVVTAASNSPLCVGDTLALFANIDSAGTTISWTGPLSYSSSAQNPVINSTTTAHSGNYIVTVAKNNCTSVADTVAVVVYPIPAAPVAGNNGPVCEDDTLLLTATFVSGGSYSWSGPSSYSSTQQNPVIINSRPAYSGDYAVTVNENGCVSEPDTTTVLVNPTPAKPTLSSNSPVCEDDTVRLFASTISGATYTWSGPLSYTSSDQNPVIAPALPTQSGKYYIDVTVNGCSSNQDSITFVVHPTPATPVANNNGPLCTGNTLQLTSNIPGTSTSSWTGPNSFTSTSAAPSITNVQTSMSGDYIVIATANSCVSLPDTTTVVINVLPAPVIGGSSTVNPSTCSGTDGSIILTGLTPSSTYTVNYLKNTVAQSPASLPSDGSGVLTISNLAAGAYTQLTVTSSNGCTSVPLTLITLTDPTPPAITLFSTGNTTTCQGTDGFITVAGLIYNTSYTVNYDKNNIAQSPFNQVADTAGHITISNLNADQYQNINVTVNNCVSNSIALATVSNPNAPIASASNNSPICEGDTLKLFSTADSTGVTWSWTGPLSYTSTNQNPVISNALPTQSGIYIVTATKNNCTSSNDTTIVTVHPTPATPVAGNNGPLCAGSTLQLTSSTVGSSTYNWTGPLSFAAAKQNVDIVNIDTVNSGNYIVTATENNCMSLPDTTVVIIYDVPLITGRVLSSNPTTCNGTDGTITLQNLRVSTTYTVDHQKNNIGQSPLTISTNGTGQLFMTGLGAGVYSGIRITLNNCTSDTIPSVILTDPDAPVVTATNNTPVCQDDTVKLFAAADSAGVTWTWTGPLSYNSTSQNPVITNAIPTQSGTYYLTAAKNNCTSATDSTIVTVHPTPATPVANNNGPLCAGTTLQLTSSTVGAATYSWTGPQAFTAAVQNPTITNTDTIHSGNYVVIATENNCPSEADTTVVVIHDVPRIDSFDFTNPTTCNGTEGTITLKGLKTARTYTVNFKKNGVTQSALAATTSGTGELLMTGLGAGAYSAINITLDNCTSDTITTITLTDPDAPVVTATNNTPVCQDDTVKLFAAADSAGVTWTWTGPLSYNSTSQNPVITNAIPTQSGTYYLTASKNNCTSAIDSTIVTVHPTPATPVANNNGPLCAGTTLQLTSSTVGAATYSWTGPQAFTAAVQNPTITNTDTIHSGNYIVTATENNCPSEADTTVVVIHDVPRIDSFDFTNPTTCNGTEGTITLKGLKTARTYTVNFKKNGVTQSALAATTSGTGELLMTGLGAGAYSAINITLDNCTSDTITTITLTDPDAPVVTATNNTPVCQDDTVKLFAAADSAGVTWAWTGPLSYNSTNQNPVITNAIPTQSGTYYLTAAKNNCTSAIDSTIVTVHPTPATPVANNNGPLCAGTTLQLTSSTVGAATYSWTGPQAFTAAIQNPTITNTDTIHSGNYIVIATENNCPSEADTTVVVIHDVPRIDSFDFTNPITCNGTEGTITLKGLKAARTYTVNFKKNGVTQSALAATTSGTGELLMTSLGAGAYSAINITLDNCTSDTITTITLTDPDAPVVTATNNTPVCQDDTVKLFAAADSAGVTWAWTGPLSYNSTNQNPVITNAIPTQSGTYYLTASKNNCTSAIDSTIVTVHPTPATPVANNNGPLCAGTTLQLTSSTVGAATYSWTGPQAFTAAIQNPTITNTDTIHSGNYIVIATENNCPSEADTTVVVIHDVPRIDSFDFTNPITCNGTEGIITLKGLKTSRTYTVNFKKNGVAQSALAATTSGTGELLITGLGAGAYSAINITLDNCTSDTITTITLTDPDAPVVTATNNTPVCQDDTVKLFAAADSAGVTWTWTGPLSYTSTDQNPVINNAIPTQSGTYYLTASKNNCTSAIDSTIVTVHPTPALPGANNNGPLCSGNTLNLSATTFAGATYQWTGPGAFTANVQNPAISNAQPAISGKYYVVSTINGCISPMDSTTVVIYPIPAPITGTTTIIHPSTCNGTDGQIIIEGLDPSATYGVNFRKNNIVQSPINITTNSTGILTITNLSAGNYSYVAVTSANGCTSDTLPTFVLVDPVPPVINIISSINPTTCSGSNGYIVLDGFLNNTNYVLSYSKNSITQAPTTITSSTSGTITISGLTSGTYDSFQVEIYNCYSNIVGPTILSDPNAPVITATNNTPVCEDGTVNLYGTSDSVGVTWSWTGPLSYSSANQNPVITNATPAQSGNYILSVTKNNCTSENDTTVVTVHPTPATPVANNNGPLCSGSILQLTSTTVSTATYSWTGPLAFTSTLQNPTINNVDTPNTGNYIVIAIENNCPSLADTTTVVIHDVPFIDSFSYTHPTTCAGSDGTITLKGMKANRSYTVNYDKNSVAQATLTTSTNATGQLLISGLTAGTYSGLNVTLDNCTSDTMTSVVLADPNAPVVTATNNTPVCEGDTIKLFSTSDSTGVTWSWTGPLSYSSTNQNPIISNAIPAQSGNYILSATKNNCTSENDTTFVTVHPTPATPIANSNSPLCKGNTLLLTSSTVGAATYSWTGPQAFASSMQNPSISNVDTIHSGNYIVIATENNCPSLADTVAVIVYEVPIVSSFSSTNPTTCNGTEGTITINGLRLNANYTVDYLKNSIAQAPLSLTSNGTGQLLMTGLTAGTYSGITVTANNCTSLPLTNIVLIDPNAPVVTAANNTPVCEDDTVRLFGLADSVGVTWLWSGPLSYSSTSQNPVITAALPTQSGVYTLTATKNNCTSAGDTTTVIVHPTPTTPVAASNSPLCDGSTLQLTSSSVGSATYSWTGPKLFTASIQNPTLSNADTSKAGNYIVIATENNCASLPDTTVVIIYDIPQIDTFSFTHPTTCGGTEGTLTLTGLRSTATYRVNFKKNSIAQASQTISSNSSGNLLITGLTAGIYTGITVTLNNCTSDSITSIILNDPNSPKVTATNNTPVCETGNFQLFGAADSTGVTWSWSGPLSYTSTIQNPAISNAIPTMSGVYVLSVSKNNCVGTDTTNVTVYPTPPKPTATNNGSLCSGDNLQLSALTITGAGYSWTGPNSYTSSIQNPILTGVDTAMQGKYIVTATVNGCASPSDTTTVTIYHTPSIAIAASTHPTTCFGTQGSITFTGLVSNTSFTLTYKKNGVPQSGTAFSSNGTGVLIATGLTAGVYDSIRIAFSSCPSNIVGPITLNDPVSPLAFASNNTPICEGDTIKLTGQSDSTGVTWSWTGPVSYTSATQNPTILNALPAQSGYYYLTATKNNCTSPKDSTLVTVYPTPQTPVVSNNGPLCPGNTLNLSAGSIAGASYAWTGPLSFASTNQNTSIANVQPTHSGSYIVTATVNGCPSLPASTTVVVNTTPAAPVVISPLALCQDVAPAALTATGSNLLWYTTAVGGTGTNIAPIPPTTSPASFTWYVSQTVNGCEGPRARIDVVVNPKPVPPVVTPKYEYCQFATVPPLTANGTSLTWYLVLNGGVGTTIAPTPSSAVTNANKWYVSQTDANGCESDRSEIEVTILPNINSEITLSKDTICQYDNVEVVNNITTTGLQYVWNFANADIISGTGGGPYILSWNDAGNKQIKVAISNSLCGQPDSETVYVSPIPDGSFTAEGELCLSQDMQLTPNWTYAAQYMWTLDGGTIIDSTRENTITVKWDVPGDKIIVLVVISSDGCLSSPNTHMVTIHEEPIAVIEYVSDNDVCTGDTITIRSNAVNAYEYNWSSDNAKLSSNNQAIHAIVTEPSLVVLKVENQWGCKDYDTVAVTAHSCCEVSLPNAFTPNGDGLNDIFRIITNGKQTIGTFIIVDRWGKKIFETNDPLGGWDGTYKGVGAEIGTYHYYIKYTCTNTKVFEKKGEVILVR